MATSVAAADTAINAFQFHASDEALADLRRRIAATNWPDGELVSDTSQGVPIATMRKLARYQSRLAEDRSEAERLAPIHDQH